MIRNFLLSVVVMAWTGQIQAASWADGLFDELSRDFGAVPRGTLLTHPFRVANNTQGTVSISNVRVSCGCTTARAIQNVLKPGEETAIFVQMDTRRFLNTKAVTVYVTFNQPRFEEARILVQANSREDVIFAPEGINFGKVKKGTAPTARMAVTFLGSSNMKITEVSSESNYVQPKIVDTGRDGVQSSIQIQAVLRQDTPPGKWFTDVWLKTNNPSMPKLRVPVTVEVEAELSMVPNNVQLGQVKAGTETDRKVVLRGQLPFRIVSIKGTDGELRVKDSSGESKTMHILTVTLHPRLPGELNRTLRVLTDMTTGGEIEINAQAQVVP